MRRFPAGRDGSAQRSAQLMVNWCSCGGKPASLLLSASTNCRPAFLPSFLSKTCLSRSAIIHFCFSSATPAPRRPNQRRVPKAAWLPRPGRQGLCPQSTARHGADPARRSGRLPRARRGRAVLAASPWPYTSSPSHSAPRNRDKNALLNDAVLEVALGWLWCATLKMP